MNEESFPAFDFGTVETSSPKSVVFDTPSGTIETRQAGAASAEANAHLAGIRKSGRGRPRKDEAALAEERAKIREELTREFAALFSPEHWEGIVRGPADLMLHVSGRELWNIPERELKPLAVGAAQTARHFLQADPKWIALFMFSVSLVQVYGVRAALHMAQVRKETRDKTERKESALAAVK